MGNASASKHGAMGWADDEPGSDKPAEFIPTTEQVRDGFATDPVAEYNDPITNHTAAGRRVFDRWLAVHDAGVAAKALDNAAFIAEERMSHLVAGSFSWHQFGEHAADIRALIAAPTTPEGEQDA